MDPIYWKQEVKETMEVLDNGNVTQALLLIIADRLDTIASVLQDRLDPVEPE